MIFVVVVDDVDVVVVSIALLFTDSNRFITPVDDVIIILTSWQKKEQFIICNQNENIKLEQNPTTWYIG